MTKIFVSYNHQQGEWVWERLLPCLKAGGAEVLIDRERFKVGKAVVGQMDTVQDQADKHLLVLSPEYLNSTYCKHEMNRVLKRDPKFAQGIILPVLRVVCPLPASFSGWNLPLYANLQDDRQAEPWNALLQQCDANRLGTTAPAWLAARDDIVRLLERGQSVNLVVHGEVNWRGLLEHISDVHLPDLAVVNLEDPDTTSRHGLPAAISQALGERAPLRQEPHDLAGFKALLVARSAAKVALTHFDLVPHRPYYDVDLFAALRYFIMEARKLVLLVQSRTSFSALLPCNHPLSVIDIKTVKLQAQL
jgi:hypothetical protein